MSTNIVVRRVRPVEYGAINAAYAELSQRERQVMGLVTAGLMNKQVAYELGISEITVKAHRGRMMRKMGKEMGEDLPPEFDEVVDRLESGQSPDDIEKAIPDLGGDAVVLPKDGHASPQLRDGDIVPGNVRRRRHTQVPQQHLHQVAVRIPVLHTAALPVAHHQQRLRTPQIDRQPVKNVDDLERAIRKRQPGSSTLLLVHRNGSDLYIALGA